MKLRMTSTEVTSTWSNELASHVIELKTTRPVTSLTDWDFCFAAEVQEIQQRLQVHDARLLPTGMHPWMNPAVSLRLWPYGHQDVYQAFDRLFQCRGHGWANLQSVHLNLPFGDDAQFARLHAAIRLVLPLFPALAASSPFCEGHATGRLDHRLHVYRTNARTIPSVTGEVVPETVSTAADYHRMVLEPMYRDVGRPAAIQSCSMSSSMPVALSPASVVGPSKSDCSISPNAPPRIWRSARR